MFVCNLAAQASWLQHYNSSHRSSTRTTFMCRIVMFCCNKLACHVADIHNWGMPWNLILVCSSLSCWIICTHVYRKTMILAFYLSLMYHEINTCSKFSSFPFIHLFINSDISKCNLKYNIQVVAGILPQSQSLVEIRCPGKHHMKNSLALHCSYCIKGDLQTIFRFSYLKVHKLITMGMKFKNL